MIPLADIRDAERRLHGRLHRTPIMTSAAISDRAGTKTVVKCECFQKTGSFKPRGALNKALSLSEPERARGLITVSAGNHAQAVAWAAREVRTNCVVVMPADAPQSKIEAVRGYGAEIVFHTDRATLFDRLHAEIDRRGNTFIHPFDDPVVLAGAGTLGLEIIEDAPETNAVFVPVGGGGLLAGVTSAIKAIKPEVRIVAVELEEGPGLGPALIAGKPVPVPRPDTLADGMTPPFVGQLPFEITCEQVDEVVTVTEEEIIDAMRILMTRCKLFVEASGAAATAALIHGKVPGVLGTAVVIASGGNIDAETLASVFAKE